MNKSTKAQIRNVLALFISAFGCAGLLAAYMIYHYGPTGRYIAGHTLLSPFIKSQVKYPEVGAKTGKGLKYVYKGTEFAYYDQQGRKQTISVADKTYEEFYRWVETEKSVENIPTDIEKQFEQKPASLILTMGTDSHSFPEETLTFQVIQFTTSGYFRVQLRNKESSGLWAYFYRPHLYQDVLDLVTKNK